MITIYPPDLDGVKKEIKELSENLKMSDKLEIQVKRGDKSWNYFVIVCNILLVLVIAIISVLSIEWLYKVVLILISSVFIFWLCFFNAWFRNKIVGIMSKSQEKVEKL